MAVSLVAQRAAIRKLLLEDPVLFIEYYSGLRLDPFQHVVLKAVTLCPRLVLMLPATHGKSTLVAKWYLIWRICQNPNIRVILVMKSDSEVKQYARSIRLELEKNKKLISDFGPFKPLGRDAKWNDEMVEVYHRQITDQQPTIEFASSNAISQVLGHRCDEFLCDDIVTPKSTNTQDLRDQQESDFNMGVQTGPAGYIWDIEVDELGEPILDPEGFEVFVNKPAEIFWPRLKPFGKPIVYRKACLEGTVFHVDDLIHRKGCSPQELTPGKLYRGNDPTYKVLYYDCFEHDDENLPTERPIMPSRWSKKALEEQERSMGAIDFAKRFRNIAVDESQVVFKKIWIVGGKRDDLEYPGCLNKVRSFGEFPQLKQEQEPSWYLSLGLDPSSGRKGESASWSAYVLLAVDMTAELRRRYVIDIFHAQLGYEDILSHLLDGDPLRDIEGFWNLYHYDIAVVEKVSFSNWLMMSPRRQSFEMEHKAKVIGMETQVGNKWDPISGVSSMQSMVRDGLLDIPYNTPTDREKARPFLEHVGNFPEGLNDYAMALWFANLGIRDSKSRYRSWAHPQYSTFHPTPTYARA